jgi:hypothetical protein
MSRISRYQDSIESFIKKKDIDTYLNDSNNKILEEHLLKFDHLCGIIVSTIFNYNAKKTNFKGHGYFLAICIDILLIIVKLKSNCQYREKYVNLDKIVMDMTITSYKLLVDNISTIKNPLKSDEINKIITFSLQFYNQYIYSIVSPREISLTTKMIKSDLLNLKYINPQTNLYKKLMSMNRYSKEDIIKYVEDTYCNIGKIIFVLGWGLGGGSLSDKTLYASLNSIGYKLGLIYAISNDFDTIEKDILNSDPKTKTTKNIVINLGIQESFQLYMENKSSFIEECMKLNLFTHTLKEVIDLFEEKIDKCLEQSTVDMKSTYSSFSVDIKS